MIKSIAQLAFMYVITRTFIELAFPAGRHLLKYIYWSAIALTLIIAVGPMVTQLFDDIHVFAVTYSQGKEAVNKGLPGIPSLFKGSWRAPIAGEITQQFDSNNHHGVDIAAPLGTPVEAIGEGMVTRVEWSGVYGNMIIINHGKGIESLYGHLLGLNVKVGKPVVGGEVIGTCGSTGRSTGPHLHFEIRVNGTCVDPAKYLK